MPKSENGTKISDKNQRSVKFRYLENKKRQKDTAKSTRKMNVCWL